jgi:PAS domain-containing protein
MASVREPETVFEAALVRLSDVLSPGSLLEATPESLVVAETDGAIAYANGAFERLTGFEKRDVLGRPVGFLLEDDPASRGAGDAYETTCTLRDGRGPCPSRSTSAGSTRRSRC